MSNFFNKSDLTRQDADKIVSETLNNCDDGELYLEESKSCLLYTSPSPRDRQKSRMPSSA